MSNSDIFNEFAKIATKQGLIKTAQDESGRNTDKSRVEKLYNLKPSSPKEMEYKKNIAEIAHPDPKVLSSAHDKLNGLVENINERQNIILNIVTKNNHGQLIHPKYAKKDLLLSLTRIANDLDNKNNEELRKLADYCLLQMSGQKLVKNAFFDPLTIGIGISLALGAIYAYYHLPNINQKYRTNYKNLIQDLDDLINTEKKWYGGGYDLTPGFKKRLLNVKKTLSNLNKDYNSYISACESTAYPQNNEEKINFAKTPEGKRIEAKVKQFKNSINNRVPLIIEELANLKKIVGNEEAKDRVIQDRGWVKQLLKSTYILHGGMGLIGDDFDDINNAIPPFVESLQGIIKSIEESGEEAMGQNLGKDLSGEDSSEPEQEATKQGPTSRPAPTDSTSRPSSSTTTTPSDQTSRLDLSQHVSNLTNLFTPSNTTQPKAANKKFVLKK